MNNSDMKRLRLNNIAFNPALSDGNNGFVRCEAAQWILDERGNVTDIKHRLEAETTQKVLYELERRANIVLQLHNPSKEK